MRLGGEGITLSLTRGDPDHTAPAHTWEHERRRLNAAPDVLSEAPLFIGTGTHYTNLFVGSPPQRVSVIIDTGSHIAAFPCSDCVDCGVHTDVYFNPTLSSTSKELQCGLFWKTPCTFHQGYLEGSSWFAYKVVDKLWIGQYDSTPSSPLKALACDFVFGCQNKVTGLFRSQISNGIMGFGNSKQTFVPSLVRKGVLQHEIFSLCFALHGGTVVLGGMDTRQHRGGLSYTEMGLDTPYYTVHVRSVRVGRVFVPGTKWFNQGKRTFVDSGTTNTYLPLYISSSFRNAFQQAGFSYVPGRKYKLSVAELEGLPSVFFEFGKHKSDITVEVKPTSYMVKLKGKEDTYRAAIFLDESSGATIGANAMRDHDVVFDVQAGRMGWAEADCESESSNHTAVPSWHYDPARSAPDSEPVLPSERGDLTPNLYDGLILVVLLVAPIVYMMYLFKRRKANREQQHNEGSTGLYLRSRHKRAPGEGWRAPRHKKLEMQSPESPERLDADEIELNSIPRIELVGNSSDTTQLMMEQEDEQAISFHELAEADDDDPKQSKMSTLQATSLVSQL